MTSRRRFLGGALAAVAVTGLAGCAGGRSATSGPLGAEDLETLTLAAMTLLDSPRAVAARYRELIGWRARKLPAESRVLSELCILLDDAATGGSFRAATPAARRRALDVGLGRRSGVPIPLTPLPDVTGADRFERYFVLPVIALYARTDAWLDAGYSDHPGLPRVMDTVRESRRGGAR